MEINYQEITIAAGVPTGLIKSMVAPRRISLSPAQVLYRYIIMGSSFGNFSSKLVNIWLTAHKSATVLYI